MLWLSRSSRTLCHRLAQVYASDLAFELGLNMLALLIAFLVCFCIARSLPRATVTAAGDVMPIEIQDPIPWLD